jgi:ATP-binding cassette subfamily B protein
VGAGLYAQAIAHSFSLPYAVFEDQRSGELLQKLQKARSDSQALITSSINTIFLSLVGILFVLSYAFTVHWIIGLVYFLIIPTLGLASFFITRKVKRAQGTIVAQTAELAGSTTETLRNVELVKSLGLEAQETLRLNTVNERILGLELTKVKLIRKLSFIQGTLINALRSSILLLMLWLMFQHDISLGQFFSLLFYSFFIFNPLSELGTVATQYQEARASLELLDQILQLPPAPKPASPAALGALDAIAFRQVSFHYEGTSNAAVDDITLNLTRGQTIAFVGPSGSGKSTLVKLLVGLYAPTSGQLTVNGADSSSIDYEEFRRRIGYVSQETQLFAGTIRENLLFVRPGATDAECLEALKHAEALSIVERGGKGLDTKIGEGGIKISGGERQRLAIARALLRNPELIIFDEATSSLDSLTEQAITQTIRGINQVRPNLITVLVAHRLSTVAHANTIYVLEHGRLLEQGSHDSLVDAGGLYAALWRGQRGGER